MKQRVKRLRNQSQGELSGACRELHLSADNVTHVRLTLTLRVFSERYLCLAGDCRSPGWLCTKERGVAAPQPVPQGVPVGAEGVTAGWSGGFQD